MLISPRLNRALMEPSFFLVYPKNNMQSIARTPTMTVVHNFVQPAHFRFQDNQPRGIQWQPFQVRICNAHRVSSRFRHRRHMPSHSLTLATLDGYPSSRRPFETSATLGPTRWSCKLVALFAKPLGALTKHFAKRNAAAQRLCQKHCWQSICRVGKGIEPNSLPDHHVG